MSLKVSKSFLQELNRISYSKRPEYRRSKAEIDIALDSAILLPDLFLETFSCEIKVFIGFNQHYDLFLF